MEVRRLHRLVNVVSHTLRFTNHFLVTSLTPFLCHSPHYAPQAGARSALHDGE